MPETDAIQLIELDDTAERALRTGCALVDRSERGKLAMTGDDAAECLNGQLTNDITKIEPGCGQYAALLTTKGQMLGDVRVVRTADTYELDTERGSLQALFEALTRAKVGHKAEIHKRTLQRGLLSLIGPRAIELTGTEDLAECEYCNAPFQIGGIDVHVIHTIVGIDLLCDTDDLPALHALLVERGATPVERRAAEVIRIEHGRPRYGVEMGERTMPQEAALTERAVSFTKGCYTGQETVARLYHRGSPNRTLRGLRFDRPPTGDGSLLLGDKAVGEVHTVARSRMFGLIALALVRVTAEPGTKLTCGEATATVVELPFPRPTG